MTMKAPLGARSCGSKIAVPLRSFVVGFLRLPPIGGFHRRRRNELANVQRFVAG